MKTVRVHVTRNFSRNLDSIEEFLHEADAPDAFAALLDDLFDEVIPTLETYPELGTDFFARRATSREALAQTTELRRRLGLHTSLRELIRGDYLLPYARNQELFSSPPSTTDSCLSTCSSTGRSEPPKHLIEVPGTSKKQKTWGAVKAPLLPKAWVLSAKHFQIRVSPEIESTALPRRGKFR